MDVPEESDGPQVEIIDNVIVVKQASLLVKSSILPPPIARISRRNRNTVRSAHWTSDEIVHFFACLRQVGTDFSMMAPLFPTRTRRELKQRFKREEKEHPSIVNMALRARIPLSEEAMVVMLEAAECEVTLDV